MDAISYRREENVSGLIEWRTNQYFLWIKQVDHDRHNASHAVTDTDDQLGSQWVAL